MKGENMDSKDKKTPLLVLRWFNTFFFVLLYASSLRECFILIVSIITCVPMATRSLCQGVSPCVSSFEKCLTESVPAPRNLQATEICPDECMYRECIEEGNFLVTWGNGNGLQWVQWMAALK